jgi:hypothetical protein
VKAKVTPVTIRATGSISKSLTQYLSNIQGKHEIKELQKSSRIGHCTNIVQSAYVEVMVKCTLVQALRLCTGRAAHRESRGIAVPFHDHGTRRG